MEQQNFLPVYIDDLPDCHSKSLSFLRDRGVEWTCPYEVDRRLFDFAETVFEPFMSELDEDGNRALYNVINNSRRGLWAYEYDNLSDALYKSQNIPVVLGNLAWILSGIGILSLILLFLNLVCRKAGYFSNAEKGESRPRLFLRGCVYIFLFTAILLGAIGYAGVVVDVNTRWILNVNLDSMDKEIQISKAAVNQTSLKPFIQDQFHMIGEELQQRCQAAAARNGNGLKNFQISVYQTWSKAYDLLQNLATEMVVETRDDRNEATLAFVKVVKDLTEYSKELHDSVKTYEYTGWDTVDQWQLERIGDSQRRSLEESLGLVDQMERKRAVNKEKNEILLDWLTDVFAFVSNAHKRQLFVHFDYDFYQIPVAVVVGVGIAFLLIGYFATFYKFIYPAGKPEARGMEKWLGRLVYVGYFYFILTTCYLSWNFMTIAKPTIAATSTCRSVADTKSFLPGSGTAPNQFYRLKEFQDFDGSPFNPKWQRGGRNVPMVGRMSFLDTLGQIMQQQDQLQSQLDFDNFTNAFSEWRNNIGEITKSCYELNNSMDKKYVDKLKMSIGKLVQAVEEEDHMNKDNRLYNLTMQLAATKWDYVAYMAYQSTPTAEETTIETMSTRIGREIKSNWKKISQYDRYARRLFLMAEGIICGQWARPSVALLVTAIIITILWVLCTVTMLSTARRWDLGEVAAPTPLTAQDALGTPLIDKTKLEEALYDNPIAYIQ